MSVSSTQKPLEREASPRSESDPSASVDGSPAIADEFARTAEGFSASANGSSPSARVSRRRFLQVAGGVAGAAAVGGGAFELTQLMGPGLVRPSLPAMAVPPSGPVRAFHSRPDLRPPAVTVSKPPDNGGNLVLGP